VPSFLYYKAETIARHFFNQRPKAGNYTNALGQYKSPGYLYQIRVDLPPAAASLKGFVRALTAKK
jgi:hypothetical protein